MLIIKYSIVEYSLTQVLKLGLTLDGILFVLMDNIFNNHEKPLSCPQLQPMTLHSPTHTVGRILFIRIFHLACTVYRTILTYLPLLLPVCAEFHMSLIWSLFCAVQLNINIYVIQHKDVFKSFTCKKKKYFVIFFFIFYYIFFIFDYLLLNSFKAVLKTFSVYAKCIYSGRSKISARYSPSC